MHILLILLLIALVFGPQLWVRQVMRRYSDESDRIPGTGGKLAVHLIKRFGLEGINVEKSHENNDQFDPNSKTVRLSPANYDGKSLTAVAIAAHEVGHAIQFHRNEVSIRLRTTLFGYAKAFERAGIMALFAIPIVTILTHVPHSGLIMFIAGFGSMIVGILCHLANLPVEWDASFSKALPILINGNYIREGEDLVIRKILKAAALTYVAAALADILNLWRWLVILRR